MWHKNNRRRGFLGHLKSLFQQSHVRSNRSSWKRGPAESLEARIVLAADYVEDHVIVRMEPGADFKFMEELDIALGKSTIKPMGNYGLYLIKLPAGLTVPDAIDKLRQNDSVIYAQPDWIGQISAVPNDPAYNQVWGLTNTGQTLNGTTGTADADIDADLAWDITTGSSSVIVAVNDTGIDDLHPDLIDNLWTNPGEVAGNGIDDDGNGYVDDIHGYDFVNDDAVPYDGHGHGTHVSGTIGATGNNNVGMVGVNWDVTIMAIKVASDFGFLTTSAAIQGINYAVDNGAFVSNHSYGVFPSQALEDSIIRAGSFNHLVIAAAGNSSSNIDIRPAYPAAFPEDNIIAVAATDQNDNLASFSSFGPTRVDLGAPGVNVWSTTPRAGGFGYAANYSFSNGTSMATPMVTGAVALLRSVAAGSSYTEIKDAILQGVDLLPSLTGRVLTGGRLNVYNALQRLPVATISVTPASISENDGTGAARITIQKVNAPVNQPLTLTLVVSDTSEATVPALAGNPTFVIPAGQTQISFTVDAVNDDLLDGTQNVVFDIRYLGASVDTAVLAVLDHEFLTVVANPSVVAENAGPNAGTLTISRSNTDVFAPPRVAAVGNELKFYNKLGVQVGASVTVPWPTGPRPVGQNVRDIATMEDGRIAVFNGTSTIYVSLYNPSNDTWVHQLVSGATASSADNGTGGITTVGNYVFLSDLQTSIGDPYGIVRVDVTTMTVTRFGTKSFGDRLFAAGLNQTISELNPQTGAVLRSFAAPVQNGFSQTGLGFDGVNLWFIDSGSDALYKLNPDTGAVLDSFNVRTNSNSGFEGIAVMNGYVYLLDALFVNEIVVFDPILRQVVNRLPVGTLNGGLNLEGGLAANPSRNSLYVTEWITDQVYEVSAANGAILRTPAGVRRQFASGTQSDLGLATVGNRLFVGPYLDNTIRILDLDGVFQGSIPLLIPNNFFGVGALGGDGVQGLVDTSYRYRDTVIGLDGSLYALDNGGLVVAQFDTGTLNPTSFLTLSEAVTSIAIDGLGNLFGGTAAGDVVAFDSAGAVTRRLSLGIGLISDLDLNISGDILAGSSGGSFAVTATSLSAFTTVATGTPSSVFMSFGEHISKNRGELVVTITNSDVTELTAPLTVLIPEGQQSITVPFGAVDDNLRDGSQDVIVSVAASGYSPDDTTINVTDFEQIAVDVEAPSMKESAGTAATRVKVSRTDVDGPFNFADTQTFPGNPNDIPFLVDAGTRRFVINVPSQISRLTDVNVTINLSHENLPDLDVFLVSPKGTRIELFTDLNTNSTSMVNTTLDDEANTSILTGSGTFSDRYMPERALSKLIDEPIAGDWTLEITDDNIAHVGQLNSWSLSFKTVGLEPTVVTLSGNDLTEAGFSGSTSVQVLIPANQSTAYVNLDAIDDTLLDGTQVVTVTATATNTQGLQLGSDTVQVTDDEKLTLSVSRTSVLESAGPAALIGTLTRFNSDITQPFTVQLSSSDTTELTVPASVTIPANQTFVTFNIAAVDDNFIDGTQQVTITASAPAYGGDLTAVIAVEDIEPSLALTSNNTTVREDGGTIEVTVTRLDQANMSQPMIVNLSSANVPAGGTPTISVPANVVIPANQSSVTFVVTVVDDNLLDGTQVGQITASANNVISGTLNINVTDAETVTVTVDKAQFLENAGANAAVGTVTRSNTNVSQPLVVTLTSSDTSELTVPATVTIEAGQSSATFEIAAVNDPNLDGPQAVQISAAATGYIGVSGSVTVLDHEPPVVTSPGAKTVNPLPTISWNAIPGAIRYDVQVANLSSGANFLIFQTVTGTSLTPFEKLGIGRYRVWVRAVDALERPGFWSNPRDFFIETAPTITGPIQTGTVAYPSFPEISWTAVADATRYELWVNNNTTGKARVISQTNVLTTSYKSTEGLSSGTYTAFVRAFNASSEVGQWSNGQTFTVLAAPSMITPSTGGTFDRTPTFLWNNVSGAKSYDIWITNRTTNKVVIRNRSVSTNSFTPATDMAVGDYTVWVRAQSGPYFSSWSAERSFSVGMPPVINSPTNNSSGNARPTFRWTSVSGTEKYELWITNLTTNARQIISLTNTSYTPAANLSAGSYRVWIRAISVMGEKTAWSQPVAFTVAELDAPSVEPLGTEMMLASLPSSDHTARKAVAQPKSVVAQVEATASAPPRSIAQPTIHQRRVDVVMDIDASAFDAVMESWDASDWWAPADVTTDQKLSALQVKDKARQN